MYFYIGFILNISGYNIQFILMKECLIKIMWPQKTKSLYFCVNDHDYQCDILRIKNDYRRFSILTRKARLKLFWKLLIIICFSLILCRYKQIYSGLLSFTNFLTRSLTGQTNSIYLWNFLRLCLWDKSEQIFTKMNLSNVILSKSAPAYACLSLSMTMTTSTPPGCPPSPCSCGRASRHLVSPLVYPLVDIQAKTYL